MGVFLLSILLLNFLSKISFKEKHKDGYYTKKSKQVRTPSIYLPIIDNNISRKSCHYNVGVFKKPVYFIPHQFLFCQ